MLHAHASHSLHGLNGFDELRDANRVDELHVQCCDYSLFVVIKSPLVLMANQIRGKLASEPDLKTRP